MFCSTTRIVYRTSFLVTNFKPCTKQSDTSTVKIKASSELPKVSLVNTSLKKLKYHLAKFDTVVKKRITPDAITESSWGFEHTKFIFKNKIIPFLKTLKGIFNVFDKDLLDEITEVQTFFNQMEVAVQQYIMLTVMNSTAVFGYSVNLEMKKSETGNKCLDLEDELLQEKDTIINKLRNHIKSLRETDKKDRVKQDMDEIETINIELEHSVAKLLSENKLLHKEIEHLKKIYKDQFDSIKKTRVRSKEHNDSLIAQLKFKYMENANLKGQNQEKVFVTTTLQNELRGLKGKNVLDNSATITKATTISPGMVRLDLEPLAPKELVEHAREIRPLDSDLDYACNTKNNRILQTTSSNQKNKVEDHLRKVKSKSNKMNRVVEPICNTDIKHSMLNANSELICATCNQYMFDAIHDTRVLDFVKDVNVRSKSKSAKSNKKQNIWKPTGKVFTDVGYRWKPTGRTFTLDGISCPLTRITSTKIVHLKKITSKSVETQKPEIKVYSRTPKLIKSVGSSSKSKIVESRISNTSEPNQSWGSNASDVPYSSSLVDYRHPKPNLGYSIEDYPLWNQRLSNLNFDYITRLVKQGMVHGLTRLKFQKDHLCFACALRKNKKHSYKPKVEDSIYEKLYLLHMDLCGPMRIQNINGKIYILVIVDDYSRFTWVKSLRSKDEVPEFVIKLFKMIQVRLNATVQNIRADNGIEFVNQTLRAYYENVGISHQTSVARTPQQNDVVERRNRTHVEAARTMLIFSKALLFLWAKFLQFNEYFNPLACVVSPVPAVVTPVPADSTGSPSSTPVDQDAPSPSTSQTPPESQSQVIPPNVKEEFHDIKVAHPHNNPFFGVPIPNPNSE
ncbi:retrovirus-related pol polyprotein from transposon TNT 1-94 [Tanacetum coccineum]